MSAAVVEKDFLVSIPCVDIREFVSVNELLDGGWHVYITTEKTLRNVFQPIFMG
ncbi:hypothetical protein HDU84_004501 [Entophlyctis sp. JEL0112]|nr:hypothetical protein HDU84_004501 [Entophlyctis sp. JEL0112]